MTHKETKTPVEIYHDRVAGIYDTIYEGNPYWEAVFDITWRHVKKFLPRDQSTRCLDVGCGTGKWGLKLLKSGYPTDFLDISHRMLDQVRKKLEKMELRYEPRLVQTSVDDLRDLPGEGYGFLIGQGDPLGCVPRPEKALKELTRILAPGGVMVMAVDNKLAGLRHYLQQGDVAGLERFLKDGRTTWVTDDPAEQYDVVAFAPADIRRMCETRGLEMLSLIGKTALPLRRFRNLLENREERDRLMRLEEKLHGNENMLGLAAHLEFVARKPAE